MSQQSPVVMSVDLVGTRPPSSPYSSSFPCENVTWMASDPQMSFGGRGGAHVGGCPEEIGEYNLEAGEGRGEVKETRR